MRASLLRSSADPIDDDTTVSVDTRAKVEEILDHINADMNEIRTLLLIDVPAGTQVGWAPGSPTHAAEASKISRSRTRASFGREGGSCVKLQQGSQQQQLCIWPARQGVAKEFQVQLRRLHKTVSKNLGQT